MRIVYLEDDMILADIFEKAFSPHLDVEIVHCTRGLQVLEYVKDDIHAADIYVLDIRIRGSIDGKEVAEKLRAKDITAPIIMSSAYEKPSKQWLDTYNCQWIAKPWDLQKVPQIILAFVT